MLATITDSGVQQAAIAAANGVRITISKFSIGTGGTGSAPSTQTALNTSVYGPVAVDAVRWISDTVIEVDCFVPSTVPAVGTWAINEAGFWLDDGTLFAYAADFATTKESGSGLMLRCWFALTGGASSLTVTPSGDAWTMYFRGINLIENSDFRALGNGNLAADDSAVVFASDRYVCANWKTFQGGFSVKRDPDDGLKLTSQDIVSPAYLIQDLDRRVVEESRGNNLTFRVKMKHTNDNDNVEIGFIEDRSSSPVTIDTATYSVDSSGWAEYSVTKAMPSDVEEIAVCISPSTTNEVYIKWAVCNIEDEETSFTKVPGEKWPIATIDPEMTASEVDTLLGELSAGSQTPSVLMLPGNYVWDTSVDGTGVTFKSFGDVVVELGAGVTWSAERIECDTLSVDTTSAADNCFSVNSAIGKLTISGGHIVSVGEVEHIESDDDINVTGSCRHVEATGVVTINTTDAINLDLVIAGDISIDSQANVSFGEVHLSSSSNGVTVNPVSAGYTNVSIQQLVVDGGSTRALYVNAPASGNAGKINLTIGEAYLTSVNNPIDIECNTTGHIDIGNFLCDCDENSYLIQFSDYGSASGSEEVPVVCGKLIVRGTGSGGAGNLYGLNCMGAADGSWYPDIRKWDLTILCQASGTTTFDAIYTYRNTRLNHNRFIIVLEGSSGTSCRGVSIHSEGGYSTVVWGNYFDITGGFYAERLIYQSGDSAQFAHNEVVFRMSNALSGAGTYGIYLNPGAGSEAKVKANWIKGIHYNTGAHDGGTWGDDYYYLRGDYNIIHTIGDFEIDATGTGNDDQSMTLA